MTAEHLALALKGLASGAHFYRQLIGLGLRTEEAAKEQLARSAENIIAQNETSPFQAAALRAAGGSI